MCKIKCFKSFSCLNNIKYTYKVVGSRNIKEEEPFSSTGVGKEREKEELNVDHSSEKRNARRGWGKGRLWDNE